MVIVRQRSLCLLRIEGNARVHHQGPRQCSASISGVLYGPTQANMRITSAVVAVLLGTGVLQSSVVLWKSTDYDPNQRRLITISGVVTEVPTQQRFLMLVDDTSDAKEVPSGSETVVVLTDQTTFYWVGSPDLVARTLVTVSGVVDSADSSFRLVAVELESHNGDLEEIF